MKYTQYVIEDRTTAQKYAVKINDGQIFWEATSDAANVEPTFEDLSNKGTYLKLFIDDGNFGWEPDTIENNKIIELLDATLDFYWRLFLIDGQLNYAKSVNLKETDLNSYMTEEKELDSHTDRDKELDSSTERTVTLESQF